MEVNRFESFNAYCGPAVLSIFTSARVDDCADEISKVNGKMKVTGVTTGDLMLAGKAMGLEFKEIPSFKDRSIFWAGSVLIKLPPSQYLVTIPKHFIALEVRDSKLYICDNHTKTELELQNSARLSQKITQVWQVTRIREYVKPYPVKTEYAAEQHGFHRIDVRRIQTLSDGGIKITPIGSLEVGQWSHVQDIAYALMKLSNEQ